MMKHFRNRALALLAGWLVSSILIFVVLRILPGDSAQVIGGLQAGEEQLRQLREELGLHLPLVQQYFEWIWNFLRGDLGVSLFSRQSVTQEIFEKGQVTFPLAFFALTIAVSIAVPAGVFAGWAKRRGRAGSRRAQTGARTLVLVNTLATAVPAVWAAMGVTLLFAQILHLLPSQGFTEWSQPGKALLSLALPALTIGLIEGAALFRFVRAATISALEAPHILTAMSFGKTRFQALIGNALPSVALSIVSVLGLQLAALLSGTVVIEHFFALPGIGSMIFSAISNRDLAQAQSVLLFFTTVILLFGLLLDLVHRKIDPRMRARAL